MANIWDWYWDFVREVRRSGDPVRQEMVRLYDRAMEIKETDPDEALTLFEQSRNLALETDSSWWAMLCQHWKTQTLLYEKHDLTNALDLAVRSTVEVRKPIYADLPQRVCIHEDLIAAYLESDPVGYEVPIRETLAYMERESVGLDQCRMCHLHRSSSFLDDLRLPDALEQAWRHQQLAEEHDDDFYRAGARYLLCHLLYKYDRETAKSLIGELAQEGVEMARNRDRKEVAADLWMWQAVAALWNGDNLEAKRLYRRAFAQARRLPQPPEAILVDSALAFHETAGTPEKAVPILEKAAQHFHETAQFFVEAQKRLKKCQLLAEMGQDWHEAEAQTRATAAKLKKPEFFGDQLDELREQFPTSEKS